MTQQNVVLTYSVNQQAQRTTERSIQQVRDGFRRLSNEADEVGRGFGRLAGIARDSFGTQTSSALRNIAQQTRAAKLQTDDYEQSARKLLNTLEQTKRVAAVSGAGLRVPGGLSGTLSGIAGAAGALGAGDLAGGIGAAGQLAGGAENLGKFSQALKDVGTQALASQSPIGTLARGLQSTIPGLRGAGAGIAALGVVTGAVAVGVALLSAALEEQQRRQQALLDTLSADVDLGTRLRLLRNTQDLDTAESQLADARQAQTEREARRAELERQRASLAESAIGQTSQALDEGILGVAASIGGLGGIISGFGLAGNEAAQGIGDAGVLLEDLDRQLEEVNREISQSEREINGLTGVIREFRQSGVRTKADIEALAKAVGELEKASDQASGNIGQLADQRLRLLADNEQRIGDLVEDRARRELRAAQDLNIRLERENAAHAERLTAITAQGNARIADLNAQIAQVAVDVRAAENKQREQAGVEQRRITQRYSEERIKAEEQLQKRLQSINSTFNQAILQAQLDNSVLAALQATAARDAQTSEARATASEAEQEARKRYEAETKAAQEASSERIAQIREQAAEQRRNLQAQIDATRAATELQIQEAERAFAKRRQLDEEDRQLRADRQKEDDALFDARAKRALDQQLKDIDARLAAERNAYNAIQNELQRLRSTGTQAVNAISNAAVEAANAGINRISQLINRYIGGASGGGVPSGGGLRPTQLAFADGGLLPAATALGTQFTVGERGLEYGRVTPQGIQFTPAGRGGAGGQTIVNNFAGMFDGANIGGAVSQQELTQIVRAIQDGLKRGLAGA